MELLEKEIRVNDIYLPLLEDRKRFLILYGGAGSGKSVFGAFKIVMRATSEDGHKFLCLRKVGATVKDSIFAEIQSQIAELELDGEFIVNKTDHSFRHIPTGNMILCKGLDDPAKIKSIKGISGMWLDEATEFEEADLDQLDLRIRGQHKNYIQYILSFNPVDEDHWLKKRFFDRPDDNVTVCHSTYKDNHFLTPEDRSRLESLKDRNPLFYDVYCLGVWGVVDKSGKFLYSFRNEQVQENLTIDGNLPVWFGFDFNIDPMTVTVAQRNHVKKMTFIKSIQLDNSDIYQMTDRIRADYGGYYWMVTGDASGHNRSALVRGKDSYWKIIKRELALKDVQMRVRRQNIGLIESRVLCNAVNQTVDLTFDKEGCEPLINDCKFAKVDDQGVLIKDRNKQKNDFLDGFRYLIDANFYDYLNNPKKYR